CPPYESKAPSYANHPPTLPRNDLRTPANDGPSLVCAVPVWAVGRLPVINWRVVRTRMGAVLAVENVEIMDGSKKAERLRAISDRLLRTLVNHSRGQRHGNWKPRSANAHAALRHEWRKLEHVCFYLSRLVAGAQNVVISHISSNGSSAIYYSNGGRKSGVELKVVDNHGDPSSFIHSHNLQLIKIDASLDNSYNRNHN